MTLASACTRRSAFAALLLASTIFVCNTIPGSASAETRAKAILTTEQAARKFFDAYKRHDRAAASQVASPKALNKLNWDPKAGNNATLELQETDKGSWVIIYEGGFMDLVIFGGRVVNVKMHAD